MLLATEEFQQSYSHLFKVIQSYVKNNIDSNCTQVRGDFGVDSRGGVNHFALLSWQHKMTNDSASISFLYPFTFSCEIHLHLCDSLNAHVYVSTYCWSTFGRPTQKYLIIYHPMFKLKLKTRRILA